MKKNLSLTKLALLALPALGAFMYACQDDSIVKTSDPATKATLVKPIIEIGPVGAATECDVTTLTTQTFDRDNIYLLKGDVRVGSGQTLTIESGTVIYGEKASRGTLTILRDANILALGTATAPIVFTSSADPCDRAPGDWGGVLIMGNAPNNQSANQPAEGFPACVSAPLFGGDDCADNSGIFRYVRIEYAGIPLPSVANSEKNALTMCSVGSGTEIHHVQASYGGDDGFEWFGGCVNTQYLVSLANVDDDFDTDMAYKGNNQFGIAIRHPLIADISASNGFESDGNPTNATGLDLTEAVFTNYTLIGPYDATCSRTPIDNASPGKRFGDGLHLRRQTALKVYNTVITGWRLRGVANIQDSPSTLSHNTVVVPVNSLSLSPAPSCFVEQGNPTSPTNFPWSSDVSNICYQATECVCFEEDEEFAGMSALSGYACTAWPDVVTDCATAEFEEFDGEALIPYFGAEILTNGLDATTITYNVTSPAFVPSSNATPTFEAHFRGALGEDEGGWNLTTGWLQFNPQTIPYN